MNSCDITRECHMDWLLDTVVVSNPDYIGSVLAGNADQDLDIIIPLRRGDNIKNSFLASGFNIEVKKGAPDKLLFYKYYADTGMVSMFDIYWAYTIKVDGEIFQLKKNFYDQFMRESLATDYRIRKLAPEHRLFFILVGILVKGNSVNKYLAEAKQLSNSSGKLYSFLKSAGFSERDLKQTLLLLKGESEAGETIRSLFRSLFFEKIPFLRKVAWISKLPALMLNILKSPPPIVSIIGLDGTGKSTLNKLITGRLSVKVRTIYWGSRYMVLPTTKLHRYLERRLYSRDIRRTDLPEDKSVKNSVRETNKQIFSVRGLVKVILLFLLFINKYAEYLAKYSIAKIHQMRGSLVITDRYVFDEFLEYDGPFYKWNCWLYAKFYFFPDLLIVATASPETVSERRPTISVDEAQHHLDVYTEIGGKVKGLGKRVIYLSSEQPLDGNIDLAIKEIFNIWHAK